MERLAAQLKVKPMKKRRSSSATEQTVDHLINDDILWEDLRNELHKSGVITSVGVHEIAQKFMVERAKDLQCMEQEIDKEQTTPPKLRRWASMKDEQVDAPIPLSSLRRSSSAPTASTRTSSTASKRSGIVTENLYQILQGAAQLNEDSLSGSLNGEDRDMEKEKLSNISFNSSLNASVIDFFDGLASELNHKEEEENQPLEEEGKSSTLEKEEWTMHHSLQLEEVFSPQQGSSFIKKQPSVTMKKLFDCRKGKESGGFGYTNIDGGTKSLAAAVAAKPRRTHAAQTA